MGEHQIDTTSITYLGLGTLFVLAVWLYFEKKKHPELEIGKVFLLSLTRYNITWFTGIAIFINIAEAMLAASIIPAGEGVINATSRYFGHLSISLVGILGAVTLVKEITLFFAAFAEPSFKVIAVRACRVTLALFCTFCMPALNTFLISNGLQETTELRLLWASLFQSNSYYLYLLAKAGYEIDYEPLDGLSYVMTATLVVNLAHLVIVLWDALIAMDPGSKELAEAMTFGSKKSDGKKANGGTPSSDDSKKPADKTGDNVFYDAIESLLRFYGIDDSDIPSRLATARRTLEAQATDLRGKIGAVFGKIAEKKVEPYLADVKSGKISGGAVDTEKSKLCDEIAAAFAGSVQKGLGLGMSLPKRKN